MTFEGRGSGLHTAARNYFRMGSERDDIRDVGELFDELTAEMDLLAKVLPSEGGAYREYPDPAKLKQVERRLLVRSAFAFIEAVVFNVKSLGLVLGKNNKLSPGEIALAKEEDYELDDLGNVKIRPARLRFMSNLRFAFALAAKAAGINYQLDVGGAGWQALREALPVRDRLMHPKKAADIIVTDKEVRDALDAFKWVVKQWGSLIAQAWLQSPMLRH